MVTPFAAQEQLKALVEASPIPTAIYTGTDIIISMANQPMLDLWDKDNSVIGMPIAEALPELEQQPFFDLLKHVYQSGETYQTKESKADLLHNGKMIPFYFDFTYKAIPGSDGQTAYIFHTAVDITKQVEARHKLAETEEWLTLSLSSADIGTWDLDVVNDTVRWDERCRELFGILGAEVTTYEEALSCIHPADKHMVRQAINKALNPASGSAYDIRYRTVAKLDGALRWVHCKGKAYFNNGTAYRFAGIARDITAEVRTSQRERQLLTLVEDNASHMTIADMEGNLIYMNNAAKRLIGVTDTEDITRLAAKDFYSAEELDRVQNQIIRQITEKDGWRGNITLTNKITREEIPCEVSYMLIHDPESGEVIGRGAIARDLRPEIKAKTELKRLATIVDISEDFCNYCDLEGKTLYMNAAGLTLIGFGEQEVAGSNMFAYHSQNSSRLIRKEIMPQLLSEGRWSGSLELVHQQTGEVIPIYKQLFIIRDEFTNIPVAFAGIARDLRPELEFRRKLDDKNTILQNAVKELEFLADSVPSVVWTSKPDGHLDYINKRWYEHGATSIENSLGEGWHHALHPDDEQAARNAWNHSLQTGTPYQIEFRIRDKKDQYRWWLVRALPLKNDDGKIVKWYGTNTDITEQKELQQQKDNFLGIASHELKTPITSIKAYAQVMQTLFTRSGDSKNAELVGKMDRQLNRLNSLVADLLDVTKINTGRLQFNYETFDFNEMVEEVIEDVQRTTSRHLIKKALAFKKELTGDRDRISQVVTNLLTNAIKYSPQANEIIIYTEEHETEAKLCVQDFGIGISLDKKDRVFEQFYRVSGTREYTFPGLGLGLYISSEIIKRLGGRIWVTSVENKGSTFCFSLPIKQSTV
ncbi:PAS domain S-box protein [Mucilaginibacter paludis]|uniref:histidine kinase n=1 Tax=Mucilaginibacter paludis DSM 18603 TaxID=714943 RepID=H1Y0T6_9SPHI|nr:PAS domain S-box protein [Mucilaginibacter paludis]EHQ28826.1 PAS/PAC sensor signal transduction histidine kinase [Mucilaginibacter paludis DSM 18603]